VEVEGLCHGPAGVPGLATGCLCVLSTCFVVCCQCHVLPCLLSTPPVLLTNYCFCGSTCVSLVTLVCLPIYLLVSAVLHCSVVFPVCYVKLHNSSLSACLLVFPFRGGFCLSLFYFVIKTRILLHLSPRLISLLTFPDTMEFC